MSTNYEINETIDQSLPPGVLEAAMRQYLGVVRESALVETPYNCFVCNRITRNAGSGFVCVMCAEKNGTIDPTEILGRFMGWRGYPSDLAEVLSNATGETAEALAHKAQAQEITQDWLAEQWDEETKYATNLAYVETVDVVDNKRSASTGPSHQDMIRQTPEDQLLYKSRPRPKTKTEREAEKKLAEEALLQDKARIEEAKRQAVLTQMKKLYEEAKAVGLDPKEF